MKNLSKILLASAALAAVSACSSELNEEEQAILDARLAEEAAKPTNLTALMQANPDLSTAALAVGQSGIAQELKDDGPFTSFIAPNEAFKKMLQHSYICPFLRSGTKAPKYLPTSLSSSFFNTIKKNI